MVVIRPERPGDGPPVEILLDLAFGGTRHARPSYRLRDGLPPVRSLCLVAAERGRIVGVIRYWPVMAGRSYPALLLGPIAVDPRREGGGIGGWLVRRSLARAKAVGHGAVFAVGAPGYLGRFGFHPAARHGVRFPALDDPARFLALALAPGALRHCRGAVRRVAGGTRRPSAGR